MRRLLAVLASGMYALAPTPAPAQGYPSKAVKIVVGTSPGGSPDVFARLIAQKMSESWGPVVVENRIGANGNIAAEMVSKSVPDGYTAYICDSAIWAINPHLYAKVPYRPLEDFAGISTISTLPTFLTIHPSVPATSMKELVALAQARPATLVFGSAGNGSVSHLAIELLKATVGGLNVLHVPYRGNGPAVLDLIAGEVHALVATLPASQPHIRSGRLRALAVAGLKRAGPLPEVPTMEQAGFPGYEAAAWTAVLAPAGTSYDVVTRLNLAIVKLAQSREIKDRFASLGAEVIGDTPDQFTAYLRGEIAKWAKVVKATGAKVD